MEREISRIAIKTTSAMNTGEFVSGILCIAILSGFALGIENAGNYAPLNDTNRNLYQAGVDSGIINPEKYSFQSFLTHENVFRELYNEYVSMNETEPINYKEWLVMNNFGILPDTQESLYERKITKQSTADNKRRFVNTVRKGDILITGRGMGGLVGHAALMTTDTWVVEMPGGKGWATGIKSNNRKVRKDRWFDMRGSDWIIVYRVPDRGAANGAANWADRIYYNPSGGAQKTRHITYLITPQLLVINPSYCSKVILQAYHRGVGNRRVLKNLSGVGIVVPTKIPTLFNNAYKLVNKGKF